MRPIEPWDLLGVEECGRVRRIDDAGRYSESDMLYAVTCNRRSPVRNAIMLAVLVLTLLMLLSLKGHSAEPDYQRAATVLIHNGDGLGSGVCVSRDGLIITAGHVINLPAPPQMFGSPRMKMPTAVQVTFPGREAEAARVLGVSKAGEPTDLAILKCSGNDYPGLTLASASPAVGEEVVTHGYPAGFYARLEGRVTYVGLTKDNSFDTITAWGRPMHGHSGGPLLNQRGQVVGICSQGTSDYFDFCGREHLTPQVGLYCRVESIHAMLQARGLTTYLAGNRRDGERSKSSIRASVKLRVKVYVQKGCKPCDHQKDDFNSGRIRINGRDARELFEVTWVDVNENSREADAAKITGMPTTICLDTGDRIEGYTSAESFAAEVSIKLGNRPLPTQPGPENPPPLFGPLPGEVIPPPEPPPAAAAERVEKVEKKDQPETVDGTGLKVVLLVKKQELDWWQGQAAAMAEKFAENGLKNKINAALGGKAEVVVCFERTQPDRYASLVDVIGSDGDKRAAVIVLAPKTFSGVVGVVASVVESRLKKLTDGDWKKAPVHLIFEREDQANYDAVIEALDKSEPVSQANDQSLWAYVITAIGSALAGIRDAFLGHKVKKATIA